MRLQLNRKIFTDKSTIGELAVDGTFEGFTLEDPVRPEKIKARQQSRAAHMRSRSPSLTSFRSFSPCSKEGKGYLEIPQSPLFSTDSKHIAYRARRKDRENILVADAIESNPMNLLKGNLVFDGSNEFRVLARDGGRVLLITMRLVSD